MVTRADGTPTRVDALNAGDQIVATTADGSLTTDTVSTLSIAEPAAAADFVTLTTAANASLTLTPEHHLPVGATCCNALKKAKEVAIGDTVWAVAAGKAAATTVSRVSVARAAAGRHSPVLVNGGFPVVDGFVTAFDSLGKMRLARHGLWLLEATGATHALRHLVLADRAYVADAK